MVHNPLNPLPGPRRCIQCDSPLYSRPGQHCSPCWEQYKQAFQDWIEQTQTGPNQEPTSGK